MSDLYTRLCKILDGMERSGPKVEIGKRYRLYQKSLPDLPVLVEFTGTYLNEHKLWYRFRNEEAGLTLNRSLENYGIKWHLLDVE